jgi:hypothetical protein
MTLRSVVATRTGDLLVFRKEELVLVLAPPAAQAGHAIVSILPCARGFLVATERVRRLRPTPCCCIAVVCGAGGLVSGWPVMLCAHDEFHF